MRWVCTEDEVNQFLRDLKGALQSPNDLRFAKVRGSSI
jgi:hypothetical protein